MKFYILILRRPKTTWHAVRRRRHIRTGLLSRPSYTDYTLCGQKFHSTRVIEHQFTIEKETLAKELFHCERCVKILNKGDNKDD